MPATPLTVYNQSHFIQWEKLPVDFQLPNDPVENIEHPLLAMALREALEIVGFIQPSNLIASNFGICAKVDNKTIVKAPDWVYIPTVFLTGEMRKSYTPHLEGEIPAVVMEFLSDTDGSEYSFKLRADTPVCPYK
jgi:hypothetical protein